MKKQAVAAVLLCTLSAYAIPAHAETAVPGGTDEAVVSGTSASVSASSSDASAAVAAFEGDSDLTLEKAIQLGIENSYNLQQALNTYKRNGISLENAADNLDYIPTEDSGSAEDRSAWKSYTSSNISYIAAAQNIETVKEQIAYSMVQTYYKVLSAESSVKEAEEALDIARLEEKAAAAKAEKGKISVSDNKSVIQARVEAEQALTTAESALEQERKTLNNAIGADTGTVFSLVDRPKYTEPKELDVKAYTQQVMGQAPTIRQAEQNVELAELDIRYFTWNSDGDFELTRMSVDEANQELTHSKEELEQSISSTYYNQQNLHDQYEQQQTALATAQDALELAEKKNARGLITKLEVKKAQQSVNQAQRKLEDLILQIDEAQRVLDQPWIS
ncbi:TolC family protein [Paenibacillus macerans]|uniref:TolC family protein n=1 Tax=Paenibacillus macerans TaxID=44252 RepID=UPI00203C30F9|nr:TolC family protein [Paenibacillus macerans]MCM3702492.1 TolC family protein [Paenibacillus macerans]